MARNDWYILGFALTVIAAFFSWALAVIVYRNDKKNFLNRMLALTMLFLGLWILSGFAEKILPTPNNTFTLWTFRWAYGTGILAFAFLFLLCVGLYLSHPPQKSFYYPVLFISTCFSVSCLSPYVVRSASYQNGVLKSQNGPLFPLVSLLLLLFGICSIYLLFRKWSGSSGIDRARTSVILYSLIIFLPILGLCIYLLPHLVGNDIPTNYAYLASVIPVGFTVYAIVRLRLLDIRIIIRRTGIFILGTILLSMPIILLFLLFNAINLNPFVEKGLTLLVFMILIYFAPSIWRYIQRLASRLFFSELYDELQLLDTISHKITSQDDLQSGIMSVLSEIVCPLGLDRLCAVIPPGIINQNSCYFECILEPDGSLINNNDSNYPFTEWLNDVNSTVVTEEIQRWPTSNNDTRLANNLAASHLSACIPIKTSTEKVGYYLVGEKVARKALSYTDISLLEKSSEHLGLSIDNYALAAQLSSQLKELKSVYLDLQEAYQFKSEIIDVTSHEFRTPVTLINGFAQTLSERWDQLKEEEKLSLLKDVIDACERISGLTEQFFSVSNLKEGRINIQNLPIRFNAILQSLCSSLRPDELDRLIIEAEPELYIFSDPEHIQVILKNVLENAFLYSPADKPVTIKAWKDSINDFIQIQDFGNGIPSEKREKIFDPFVRLESLDHHSKGMGLGLYIVRLLSSKLGIEVEIDSVDGIGTTVTLAISLNRNFAPSALRGSM